MCPIGYGIDALKSVHRKVFIPSAGCTAAVAATGNIPEKDSEEFRFYDWIEFVPTGITGQSTANELIIKRSRLSRTQTLIHSGVFIAVLVFNFTLLIGILTRYTVKKFGTSRALVFHHPEVKRGDSGLRRPYSQVKFNVSVEPGSDIVDINVESFYVRNVPTYSWLYERSQSADAPAAITDYANAGATKIGP